VRKATWYWRIWWWVGYNLGIYKINWWWKKLKKGDSMKLLLKLTLAIIVIAVILHLRNTPERRYMRCYNRTKSLEQCVPIWQEKWSE